MMIQLHTSVTAKGQPGAWGRGVSAQALPAFRVCRWSKVEGVSHPEHSCGPQTPMLVVRRESVWRPLCQKTATEPERHGWSSALEGATACKIRPVAAQEGSLTSVHKNTGSSF